MTAGLPSLPGARAALARAALAAAAQAVGMVALALGLAAAIAHVAGHGDTPLVPALLLAAAGVLVRAGAGAAGELIASRDARRAVAGLRAALLRRLVSDAAALRAVGGVGPAAVLVASRVGAAGPALATSVTARGQAAATPMLVLAALAVIDWPAALVVGGCLPLVPLFMILVGKHTRDETTAMVRALDRLSTHIAELVRGLPVLVGLGRAARQLAQLRRLGAEHRSRTLATLRSAFLSALVLELLAMLAVALVAVTVGLRLVGGSLDLTAGLAALVLAPEAFAPLRALGAAYHASDDATEAVTRAQALLAAPVESVLPTVDRPDALCINGLTVRYPGRAQPAVSRLSGTVHQGEVVRLVGPSGCGKSTVLDVLAGRLRDGDRADVDGHIDGLPADVALVPQHPRCTGDTVAAELRLHGAAPVEIPELLADLGLGRALANRRCDELSPGQAQLLALARAITRVRRGARLLLLDEPTAHLDAERTGRVAAMLQRWRGAVATVLVTHDPAVAALADREVAL